MNLVVERGQPCPRVLELSNMRKGLVGFLYLIAVLQPFDVQGQDTSTNQQAVKDRYTLRSFPQINSAGEWRERAREIRQQILVSCGLWPMLEKTPLNARIFGKVEHDGYSVEKVFIQTWKGFYLAGNLYRPLGKGTGPFPAMLAPHGHWGRGRLTDTNVANIPARCITFARQGIVVFSYDMVDCMDTRFADTPMTPKPYDFHREFGTKPSDQLWNISLLGVQTWNSIRALDFLESLPDVDKTRMGCNGSSSGGTQTFMLGAVDDRLAVQSPVCMVSHSMQGGCVCENAPGLRVEYSNMEIAAAPAPRPQLIVGATGDWTRATMTVEGPAIRRVYELLGAGSQFQYALFEAPHNYNAVSRGAVYDWVGKTLLKGQSFKEESYQKAVEAESLVFSTKNFPADALTKAQFIESLKQMHRENWESLAPQDEAGLALFKKTVEPMWRHTMLLPRALPDLKAGQASSSPPNHLYLQRGNSSISITMIPPESLKTNAVVILLHPEGKTNYLGSNDSITGLAQAFRKEGLSIVLMNTFLTGDNVNSEVSRHRNYFTNHFTTYNRTDLQERLLDVMSVITFVRNFNPNGRIILSGEGRAGFLALLAAPLADGVVADCAGVDVSDEEVLLSRDLFLPGIRNIGTFEGAAMLAAPHPLMLFNIPEGFPVSGIRSAYASAKELRNFKVQQDRPTDRQIAKMVSEF
jgi:hypothetical protein